MHVVLFTDILAQRENIRRLDAVPWTDQADEEFKKAVLDSYGRVLLLRELLGVYFNEIGVEKPKSTDRPAASLPAEVVAWDKHRAKLRIQSFSDTVISYAPIISVNETIYLHELYAALNAAGAMMLTCLADDTPLRGGLAVGTAITDEVGVYGPASQEAYDLESKVAGYPRIVISQKAMDLIELSMARPGNSPIVQLQRRAAAACRATIIKDGDGQYVVDFLGPAFLDRQVPDRANIFEMARSFVNASLRVAIDSRDAKLAGRYSILKDYFDRNASLWEALKATKGAP